LEDLRSWQAGALPVAVAQALSQHLAHCATCRHLLAGGEPRVPAGATIGDRQSASVEVIIDSEPAARGASLELGFLGPPQDEGELGQLDHFRIHKVIGEGGMGMVFEGEDTRLQRRVAIKVLKPEQAQDDVSQKRFLQEVRAAASLKSDHIVTIYHVGQENGVPYFAMEMLAGESLDRHLRQHGKLPLAQAMRIGREVAEGLAAAHERGLIHRDIKPSNLWLEEPGQRLKILDFGLARSQRRAERLTETGHVMGTPDYMSPEQARGKELDQRSDLFSLGSVLYELCTGRPPFEADTVTGVLTALAVDTPEPIRRFEPGVPRELENLVQQLLEKKPEDRPASAREVADRLEAIEAGLHLLAPPVVINKAIQHATGAAAQGADSARVPDRTFPGGAWPLRRTSLPHRCRRSTPTRMCCLAPIVDAAIGAAAPAAGPGLSRRWSWCLPRLSTG
jgi:serine/threonine protein kinase